MEQLNYRDGPNETLNTEPTPDHIEVHHQQQKVPLRILERRIQSLTQTTIPHDLNRLRQHKENIISYHRECNWTRLNVEQVNASRTVQVIKVHQCMWQRHVLYVSLLNHTCSPQVLKCSQSVYV